MLDGLLPHIMHTFCSQNNDISYKIVFPPEAIQIVINILYMYNSNHHISVAFPRSYDTTLEYFINVSTPCSPSAHSAGVHLEVGVFASLCQYFSESDKQWRTDGMVPLAETNASTAVCRTTHLTAFAAGLFVPPNAVSFKIPVSITLYSVLAQNVTTLLLPHVLVFFFCLLGAIWCTKLGCVVGVCFGLIKLCRGSSYLA